MPHTRDRTSVTAQLRFSVIRGGSQYNRRMTPQSAVNLEPDAGADPESLGKMLIAQMRTLYQQLDDAGAIPPNTTASARRFAGSPSRTANLSTTNTASARSALDLVATQNSSC